jgi:thiol-disulfide isomerase/thioredoxin
MRSTRVRLLSLAAAAALTLAACGSGSDDAASDDGGGSSSAASEGSSPTFVADQLGGGELDLASLDGEDTVLWFWAPWCTVCRGEAPNVTAAAEALDGDVQVIGVAGRGEVPDMEDFVSDTDTGSLTHVVDDSGDIWSSYEVAAQPAFAFIDDDGSYEVVIGAMGEEALTERMTALAAS